MQAVTISLKVTVSRILTPSSSHAAISSFCRLPCAHATMLNSSSISISSRLSTCPLTSAVSALTCSPRLSQPSFYSFPHTSTPLRSLHAPASPSSLQPMSWLGILGFGSKASMDSSSASPVPQGLDDDIPEAGRQFSQFGAGCFWGVELAFQRVPGVSMTEVGYSQGILDNPTYNDVCSGTTNHSEVVRVQYDPSACKYEDLLDVFWARHDPTTLNRQGGDIGTQYRSGIYFYTPEQEKAARESMERHQNTLKRPIVTEILPAKKFYKAEDYHQQYLAKGGRFGFKQSADKGCNDPIRCYG